MTTPIGNINERMYVPAIVITVAVFLAGIFFYLNSGEKKVSVKVFLLYTLATVLLFALMGATGIITVENPLYYFIGTQCGMLLLGIAHTIGLSYLNGKDDTPLFWNELIFTVYITLLGAFIYLFIRSRITGTYNLFFISSFLAFIFPFFFWKMCTYFLAIPHQEYKKWYFPVNKNFEEHEDDLEADFAEKKTIVAKFEILGQKEGDNKLLYNEAYAPLRYELGEWFARYLHGHNERYTGKQIEYFDTYKRPQGWNFYVRPKWYQSTRYLDADLTIGENEITGNEIIICERV